jgi:CRP-like cAMP-binding protein
LKGIWGVFDPRGVAGVSVFEERTGILMLQKLAQLKAGKIFGAEGILNNAARGATIVTSVATTLGYINASDYKDVLLEAEKLKLEHKNKFFNENVFRSENFGMSKDKITKFFHKRKFDKGLHLFNQGDDLRSIYVIETGEVKLYSSYHEEIQRAKDSGFGNMMKLHKRKNYVDIGLLSTGEFIGEMELYDFNRRVCSAVCITDCEMYEITIDNFMGMRMSCPAFEEFMKRVIAPRMTHRLEHLRKFKTLFSVNQKDIAVDQELVGSANLVQKKVDQAKDIYLDWLDAQKYSGAAEKNKFEIFNEEIWYLEIDTETRIEFTAYIKMAVTNISGATTGDKAQQHRALMLKMIYTGKDIIDKQGVEIFRVPDLATLLKGKNVPIIKRADVLCNGQDFISNRCENVAMKARHKIHMQCPNSIVIHLKNSRVHLHRKNPVADEDLFDMRR